MLERLRRSLPAKLFLAQLVVIACASLTLLVVALSIGPAIFHRHIHDALGVVPADVSHHLDLAYRQTASIALGIALGAAVLAAVGVSWFMTVRVARPIRHLSDAAQRVARGEHGIRVTVGDPDEVGTLADAFNRMAGALDSAERRRGELMADVAHELRTPLTTVRGYLEGIADGVVAPDAEVIRSLQAETRRMERLADDLARVSRAEEHQLELHLAAGDPIDLLEAAAAAARPAYSAKGVTLDVHGPAVRPRVRVDPDRIGEVLANVLENALRHTPSGGRVELSASTDGGHARTVALSIVDTGEGLAPEHLERIFERFYRVDRARSRQAGGSGIGLAIARAIVEAHGGQIHAQSPGPGLGTRVVIELPIDPNATRTGRRPRLARGAPRRLSDADGAGPAALRRSAISWNDCRVGGTR